MVWLRIIFIALFSFKAVANELNSQELEYFSFLDLNSDNFISLEEIDQSINIIFKLIDINQDKKISINEINELKNIINLLK